MVKALIHLFFITGTSGSGKTTLVEYLKKHWSSELYEIYDFDEIGVPSQADEKWRHQATEQWLEKVKRCASGKIIVICGVSVPSEILNSINTAGLSLHFGFIKVDPAIIQKRLEARKWPAALIQDNIHWAHYLEQEVKAQQSSFIVEASSKSIAEIAQGFKRWMDFECF